MEDVPTIKKDFGAVLCGQEVRDSLKIENTSKEIQVFALVPCQRNKCEDLYERLQIWPHQATAQPGKSVYFTLTYISYLENVVDNFCFGIFNCEKLVAQLIVHAQSVGPFLEFSVFELKFFRFRDIRKTVKHFEILNTAQCEAKFLFDLDEDYQTVQISQTSGVLPSGRKLSLKLTFSPSEPGIYYKQIYCILQFHKPIIFNILGIFKPKLRLDPKCLAFKYPPQVVYPNNYEAYMQRNVEKYPEEGNQLMQKCVEEYEMCLDEASGEESEECKQFWSDQGDDASQSKSKQSIGKVLAEVILTTNFIDMRNVPEAPEATALVNVSKSQFYFYQWDHDPKNHFRIEPCKGIIEPGKKTSFFICFKPSRPDLLYHIDFDVRIYPCNNDSPCNAPPSVDLPLTMSLRIIGNSFPDDSCGWIPQCTVEPKVLRLPSCVPGQVVHGTFMIKRQGHLPVTFRVVPPKDSSYVVRPSLGFFSKSFQLFVVQFNAASKEKGAYMEDLKIEFNNVGLNYEIIKLCTLVEIPEVIMGSNNSYTFEPSFPKSKTYALIPIKNPTTLFISYEFDVPDDMPWAVVLNPTGLVEPMSSGIVEVIFQPETPCEYLNYLPCLVSSTSMPEYSKTIPLTLIGSCQFGYLIATPNMYDFGECIYTMTKSVKIHLFNFSPVFIPFRLKTIHRAFPVGDPNTDVKITPSRGCIPGKGSLEVEVEIKSHDLDILQYAITCENMENDSQDALPCEDPRMIFAFRFEGVLPTFQIIDLNVDSGGPLFSPNWIWKMMSINRINKALNSITPESEIEVKFPEAMANSHPITIALLVEASRYGDITWESQVKIDCPCLEESKMSVPQTDICSHEKTVTVIPSKLKLNPRKRIIVHLILSYGFPDECRVEWTIHLPYKRKITIMASVVSLPYEELSFSSMYLVPKFSLKPVYVGDAEPPLQLFWLYNNTHKPTSYVVDKVTLREATVCVSSSRSCKKVFDCINPNGVIPPFSSVPLMLSFKPTEIASYSVMMTICMKEGMLTSLILQGEGVPHIQQFTELSLERAQPEKPTLFNSLVALETCTNFIDINYLRTFSQTKRIFFVRNRSDSETWAFQWHHFKVQNLINAYVEPEKGLIEPRQKKPMTLVVESLCHSTLMSISIPCDVINYTSLEKYEAYMRYQEKIEETAKDYFTITEKGISYEIPEIPPVEKPESKHLFITVNINIISGLNIDQKLTHKQQLTMRADNEIEHPNFSCLVKSSMMPSFQVILEKILWNILNGDMFKEKIKYYQDSLDFSYIQIIPGTKKEEEDLVNRFWATPSKNYVQKFLEKTLEEVLIKNFVNKKPEMKALNQ